MALDEAIMLLLKSGKSRPAFRLYGWEPSAITLGYSQRTAEVLDYEKCRMHGIDVTKRPTGGRAVLHHDEIAYSVTSDIDDPYFGGSIMDTYKSIGMVLCNALKALGIDTDLNKSRHDQTGNRFHDHNSCFVSTARYELTYGGKKIIGSAQRRFKNVFLQHGSILTGPGQENIFDYFNDGNKPLNAINVIRQKSIHLKSILGDSFSENKLRKALFESLKNTLGGNVTPAEPTYEELNLAQRLMNERYGSKEWVLGHEKRTHI
ncbi:MAG: lipoate--protein ligase family protein [Candidatus Latescibacteria bacterium]|nr:lipoate--protein ligase family protein [Candidatus Latescibacterota bacterium]